MLRLSVRALGAALRLPSLTGALHGGRISLRAPHAARHESSVCAAMEELQERSLSQMRVGMHDKAVATLQQWCALFLPPSTACAAVIFRISSSRSSQIERRRLGCCAL